MSSILFHCITNCWATSTCSSGCLARPKTSIIPARYSSKIKMHPGLRLPQWPLLRLTAWWWMLNSINLFQCIHKRVRAWPRIVPPSWTASKETGQLPRLRKDWISRANLTSNRYWTKHLAKPSKRISITYSWQTYSKIQSLFLPDIFVSLSSFIYAIHTFIII